MPATPDSRAAPRQGLFLRLMNRLHAAREPASSDQTLKIAE
jgi:hypothetical protein